jgi:hypothetical protein
MICIILIIKRKPKKVLLFIKNKKHKVLTVGIVLVLLVYSAMLIDTNSVMKEVRDAFLWKVDPAETINKPIDAYNYATSAAGYAEEHRTFGKANLFLVRLCVMHNFKDGYIWAWYCCQASDTEGELLRGSWYIPTKWKIHKENGKWEITKIIEAP